MGETIVDKIFIRYFFIVYYLYAMSVDIIIPKKSILGIVLNAAILLFFIYVIVSKCLNNDKKFLIIYLYIIYCFILILLQSTDIVYSLTYFAKYTIGLLCLPIGFNLLSSLKKLRMFQLTGIICMLLYVLNIVLANVFNWKNSKGYTDEGLDVGNLFSDALYLNVYVIVSVFFLIVLFPEKKKWILTLCAICAILIVVNMKRTVIGVLAIGLIIYLLFYYNRNRLSTKLSLMHIRILSIFIGLSIIVLPFFYNYIEINLAARKSSFERASEDIMNEGRMAEFAFISNEILNSDKAKTLLFGEETFNLVGTYANGRFGDRQIHGDYSILLKGLGAIGLIFWFSILIYLTMLMLNLKNAIRHEDGIIGSILYPLYFSFIIIYCISMGSGVIACVFSSSYLFASLGGMLRYFYNRNIYLAREQKRIRQ